jgi:hypothetical protein
MSPQMAPSDGVGRFQTLPLFEGRPDLGVKLAVRVSDVTECWLGSLQLDVGNFITFGHFTISSAMNWPNGLASTRSVSSRALKFGSAMPATIAAASWLDLWYNEAAPKIP